VAASTERAAGRPRNESADRAILAAAQRQLADVGYAQMSIEAVASEAGVTRPTIYRRWSDKQELAIAAVAALQIARPETPTDDMWSAIEAELVHFRRSLERPNGMSLLGMVLLEEGRQPDLAALFRERLVEPRRQRLSALFRRGVDRGELVRDADISAAVAMTIGSFYAHYIATGKVPKNWEKKTIALLRRALG
jgi:AcrR family transcriptional regulator